ncbi:MFS general substrate transporter [Fomes fomentarius]|nr:MFS general substrate transporter [Fomes fomentarius]
MTADTSSSSSNGRALSPSPDVEKQYDLGGAVPFVDHETSVGSKSGDYRACFPDVNEARVIRKIDTRVIPVLCVLYLLSFLDRVNISNAAIFGMKQDLNLGGNEFNIALVVFFVGYVSFELPSNALLKHYKPHVWLSLCMFFFGLITLLQGFTTSFSGLAAARFFLGLVETFRGAKALLIPLLVHDPRGGFGGLLASAIGKMDGVRGYRGWRWIFIIEGALTVVLSIFLFFTISDFPEEVTWLTQEEKDFVKARLYEDVGYSKRHDPLTLKGVLDALKDWKIAVGGLTYLGLVVPAYGYAYFAPTIIQSLGYGSIHTQLLSVPPWACAFALAMLAATLSDWLRMRFVFVLGTVAVSLTGFVILLVVHDNKHLQYAALFLAAMGTYSAMPIVVCWFNTNLGGHHRRAVGTAFQFSFGNIGGIVAVFTFLAKDAPRYIPGYSTSIAFLALALVGATIYFLGVSWENRDRDRLQASGATAHLSEDEKKRMGDLNPDYRYFT